MAVKVAINGFGRIGRLAFRQMFGAEGYEVVAINDLTSPKMLAHLLKYDSSQGKYALADTVSATEDSIIVDGKEIKIYAKANAAELPWGEIGVDVVLECTGFYTSKEKASAHITAGAKKVVISAPAGNDLPTIVYNVNHETLTKEDTVISAASCTTNCLAPMAKALNDYMPIESGIMCTIHAYTGDQMILDGPQRKGDLRRSRAGAINIVPNSTGAAKAIGLVIPELNGKLIGAAQRVPTPTGSTTILNAVVKGEATVGQAHQDYEEFMNMKGSNREWDFIHSHPRSVVSVMLANGLLERGYNLTKEQVETLENNIIGCPCDTARYNEFKKRVALAKQTTVGAALLDLDLTDIDNRQVQLVDVVPKGKYVLIDFWASWCGMCIHSMPEVKKLAEEYSGQLEVIAVSCDKKQEAWRKAMERIKFPFPHYVMTEKGFNDFYYNKYQVRNGVPYYMLVAPDGTVLCAPHSVSQVRQILAEVLK